MNLEAQLAEIVTEAPKHGVPTAIMRKGVIPVLRELASHLNYLEYYICQNAQENWLITTLQHRTEPDLRKKVIYAFSDLADAIQMQKLYDEKMTPASLTVVSLLFELFALKTVDSIIFMDTPGNFERGKEVSKHQLLELLQAQIRGIKSQNIPHDLA